MKVHFVATGLESGLRPCDVFKSEAKHERGERQGAAGAPKRHLGCSLVCDFQVFVPAFLETSIPHNYHVEDSDSSENL